VNPKIKQKWLKALRSGKYKQGQCALYEEGSYCCLGVLLHINHPHSKSLGRDLDLQKHHCKEFGLTQDMAFELQQMNDSFGYTFKQLAHFIEKAL
jgi:hypothetical protein